MERHRRVFVLNRPLRWQGRRHSARTPRGTRGHRGDTGPWAAGRALGSEHHDRWRLVGVLAREDELAMVLPVLKGRVRRARDHKVPFKDVAGSAATRVCREQPRNRVGFGEALTWAQPRRWAPAPCRAAGTPSAAGTSTPSTRHPCLRSVYTRGHVSVFQAKAGGESGASRTSRTRVASRLNGGLRPLRRLHSTGRQVG